VPFNGSSIHTAFGNAIHNTNKAILVDNLADENIKSFFQKEFRSLLKELPIEEKEKIVTDKYTKETVQDMMNKGESLSRQSIQQLHKDFPGFKIISAEGLIYEPILSYTGTPINYKGFLDLVITTPEDEIVIIDWKTCSWGWKEEKKNDTIVTRQLAFYKHFLSQQQKIDPKKIRTYFGLIKRTAKKDNIEIFESKVGPKKIKNALKVINDMLYNVEHGNLPKNKLSCEYCPFKNTKDCP